MLRWGDFSDVFVCISVAAGVADYGFALTARHFFQTPKKYPKRLAPTFGPRRLGFLRCGTDPGAAATVCFAAPPSAVSGCARRSLRSHARINPSAQPSDVAGGSRSRALELALIVEWCGFAAGSCAALLLLLLLLLIFCPSVTKVPRAPASGPYAGAKPFGFFLLCRHSGV